MRYRTPADVRDEFRARPRRALIITTVVHESKAVKSHLTNPELIVGDKGGLYEFGRFSEPAGDWIVVHALTPPGNSDAGLVASKAHEEFGSFNAQIFVGVAGSLKDDILIGGVVAGDYVYNAHAAKVGDKVTLGRTHSLAAAPELISAAQGVIYTGEWVDLIKPPAGVAVPIQPYPCPFPPTAVIKAIASGEEVVAGADSGRYAWIKLHMNDAGAVEMEGWGAMNAARYNSTPAIVVRGISDMCEGKEHVKDALHQPIAAAHAAAFAFGLLSFRSKALPPDEPGLTPAAADQTVHEATAEPERVEYVVNFKGAAEDWSDDKVQAVIKRFKEMTGDKDVTLVRIETGSVRLVLNVRENDLPALDIGRLRAVAAGAGTSLLGAVRGDQLAEAEIAKQALLNASADLLAWEKTLPGGGWIERPERESIEARFDMENSSTVLLGEPGSGKSALLSAIAADLIKGGATVFALKADFISTDVRDEQGLQRDLQLPGLPSDLIIRLARLQPVYLLIDQVDALASQLDLRSDRLNVILNLVRRVGNVPNVHLVLSARTFEFNHDVRLRAVEAEPVTLALPGWHEVQEHLTKAGVDAGTWPEQAREVVRIPQALKTYLSLAKETAGEPFTTYQSMLERLWRKRIGSVADGEALAALASDLAGQMAEEEALWLAAARFDSRLRLLDRLEGLGLIVRSENALSVGFSHQTVFDYVLARTFVGANGLLASYVVERQDSLFVRAKLWSALNYLRRAEVGSYEREFLAIWRTDPLRRHLRLLLIEFIGQVDEPLEFEKLCMAEVMNVPDLRVPGLKALSRGWFTALAGSVIPEAMRGSDFEAHQALRLLVAAWKSQPERVVSLIKECWLPLPDKDGFSWRVFVECPTWTPELELMAATILARTPISIWEVDHAAETIAVDQPPAVALRLIRGKLEFLLKQARSETPSEPYPTRGTIDEQVAWRVLHGPRKAFETILDATEWTALPAIAELAPAEFLAELWASYLALFNEIMARSDFDEDGYVFAGRYVLELDLTPSEARSSNREEPIRAALQVAVEELARKEPEAFTEWADANSKVEFLAVQQLIARGYEIAGASLASRALSWLVEDERRFQLGTRHGLRSTTSALIRSASSDWSADELVLFEASVLAYKPKRPDHLKTAHQRRLFTEIVRATRMELLRAAGVERLTPASQQLVATEQRALGNRFERAMSDVEGGWIGSPMEAEAMAKAKDRDILKLFNEIPDDTDWDHPKSWMRGGNIQLSRAFAEFAKGHSERALRIAEQFEPKKQERASGYALDALADDAANDQRVVEAVLDLQQRGFGGAEFRESTARAIEKVANRKADVGEDIIGLLIEWLRANTHASDAETEEDEELSTRAEDEDLRAGSLLWGYGRSSILPSGNYTVLSALASILLIQKEEGRDRLLSLLDEHLARERNPNIWKAFLYRLANAGGSTPQGVSAFLRRLFDRFPELVGTREAIIFFAFAQRWDDQLVFDLIAGWPKSERPLLQRAYGELVGLVATAKGGQQWIDAEANIRLAGPTESRIGLAYAAAHMWSDPTLQQKAGGTLTVLVEGADEELIAAIMDVFRVVDELLPDVPTVALLRALAAPKTRLAGAPSHFVVERLQSILPHEAESVAAIASKLVEAWRTELGDIRTGTVMAAPQLADLAITLHRLGGPSRQAGVAIFEAMIEIDAYGARETLAEIDGRFGPHQAAARRRLPRRKSGRGRRRATQP